MWIWDIRLTGVSMHPENKNAHITALHSVNRICLDMFICCLYKDVRKSIKYAKTVF